MSEDSLRIGVAGNLDAGQIDRLLTDLREELLELDVEAVDRLTSAFAPPGAKGPPAVEVALLVVTVSEAAVAAGLVGLLLSWTRRNRNCKVTIQLGEHKLTVDEASAEDTTVLVRSWIEMHGRQRI